MITPVKIKALSFAYHKTDVLSDVHLAVQRGEFITIIGPNGSGKTTLLKHIAKLIDAQTATVFVNGDDIVHLTPQQLSKQLSLLPQQNNIEYAFSCFDVVMMGRHPHIQGIMGETQADIDMVKAAMRETDTAKFSERAITDLSGGERQRVMLARAIAQDADIMLLDEPITFLDIHHQIDIMRRIRAHAKDNDKTVIAVLHDLNFALKFSDRVVLLDNGHVLSVGRPIDVLTKANLKRSYGVDLELIYRAGQLDYIMPMLD